jgi:hypothetical protein
MTRPSHALKFVPRRADGSGEGQMPALSELFAAVHHSASRVKRMRPLAVRVNCS